MKMSFLFLSLLFSVTSQATIISCETAPHGAKERTLFQIEIKDHQNMRVTYLREDSESIPNRFQPLDGCYPAQYSNVKNNEIYIECDGDGDAGHMNIDMNVFPMEGIISFPEGNAGHEEDTILLLQCSPLIPS